ncbi:MAG: Uncharacterised protein [Halieaceae bacterium]|nr:MAG: Uncharacterised protein [Halieaceae bacterium]
MPLWIGRHTNAGKRVIHLAEVIQYCGRAIVVAHGLIEITPRNKDRRNATVCQLRHNIAQVLLALYLSGRDVRRQGKATPG